MPLENIVDVWAYENEVRGLGYSHIAGLDEAGRGPLAGPVVAAAAILPAQFDIQGVRDSKALTAKCRDRMYDRIVSEALAFGVGIVGPEIIDEINILRATHSAMKMAVESLVPPADYVLVDGYPVPNLPVESSNIIKGDSKCISISAASIIAKVTRDRIMLEADAQYPGYGFAVHKGYCTQAHLRALDELGPCPLHRRSFSPVFERMPGCRLPGLG